MEQLSLFDLPKFDYLIIIPPSKQVYTDVKAFKERFYKLIQSKAENRFSKAHISLVDLPQSSYTEYEIVDKIKKILLNKQKIRIVIDRIETFVHGKDKKSIVLLISNPTEIREVHKRVEFEFHLRKKQLTPHITIAKEISNSEIETLKGVISTLSYSNEFVADRVSILKREFINGKAQAYVLVSEIMLN